MLRPRFIPCLLVHKGGLVKTTGFGQPKYVGDPINAVKIFNEKEADEIIVMDIDASRNGAPPDFTLIERIAVECRMPLYYGGGVKTAAQAKHIVALGVEKVAISSAALERAELIGEIASEIGSQSVAVVVDVRRDQRQGAYEAWTYNGTRNTGVAAVDAARRAEDAGAGEVVINSIDRDGMMQGYDLPLAAAVRAATSVPLTVLGGAGSLDDLRQLISRCGVIGAAAGSLFVFKGAYRAVLINYPSQQQRDDLIRAATLP